MAILKCNTGALVLWGAGIILSSVACNRTSPKQYTVSTDSITVATHLQSFYDRDGIVEGVHFITYPDGKTYACLLHDRHRLMLINILDPADTFAVNTPYSINAYCVRDTVVYCFPEQAATVKELTLSRYRKPLVQEKTIPFRSILDSNYTIKANFQSAILPLPEYRFLIPYQCLNCMPNYLDSFVYAYAGTDSDTASAKQVRQPPVYLRQYEPLKAVVACTGRSNHKLYYTFQNQDSIYICDLASGQQQAALIPDCRHTLYGQHPPEDLSYRRQYTAANDVHKRMLTDDSGRIILIRKNAAANTYPYSIFYYDTALHLLYTQQVSQHLNHEILFLKNNQLYIHAHRSPHQLYRFTFARSL